MFIPYKYVRLHLLRNPVELKHCIYIAINSVSQFAYIYISLPYLSVSSGHASKVKNTYTYIRGEQFKGKKSGELNITLICFKR